MNAFESVVAMVLRREGYWTQTSFKVELSKEQKRAIGRPSSPRWEIDLVAYRGRTNEVLAVECKSYLDSSGVGFDGVTLSPAGRYKLFTDEPLRETVLAQVRDQLFHSGACAASPKVTLCLAAGKLKYPKREHELKSYFDEKRWRFIGPAEIRGYLSKCVDASYEDDVAFVVAKILARAEGKVL
jgi:hypothetical protein